MGQLLFIPRELKAFSDLLNNFCGLFGIQSSVVFEDAFHSFALDVFHSEIEYTVIFADGISLNDIRVVEFCSGASLADKVVYRIVAAVRGSLFNDLESGRAVERDLMSQKDHACAACAELFNDDKISDYNSGAESGLRSNHRAIAVWTIHFFTELSIRCRNNFLTRRALKTHTLPTDAKILI